MRPKGRDYFAAMQYGINMSYANHQVILHRIREVFSATFGRSAEDLGMHMVYDVAHNTAKLERHTVAGEERMLLVHRKGATRAFGANLEGPPERYRDVGQPVILGGSMETGSYLLVGVPSGAQSFFSAAHGSARMMSRTKARKQWRVRCVQRRQTPRGNSPCGPKSTMRRCRPLANARRHQSPKRNMLYGLALRAASRKASDALLCARVATAAWRARTSSSC
jgi:tRNA-splicing ligase RtcB